MARTNPPRGGRAEIGKRLTWCLQKGNLTVADLARWFDRPDPTVRGWVNGGTIGGPPGDVADVLDRLDRMQTLIIKGKSLPVPRMSRRARATYLAGLSTGSPAGG